jgi:hypothetical protein
MLRVDFYQTFLRKKIVQQFRIQTVNTHKGKLFPPTSKNQPKSRTNLFAVQSTFKTFQIICYELHITIEIVGVKVVKNDGKVLMA